MLQGNGKYVFVKNTRAEVVRNGGLRQLHLENRKKVIDMNSGLEYPSIKHVAEATGFSRTLVHKIINERPGYEEYKGYKFRYA